MVRHRIQQAGLLGTARQGSILAAPLPDSSFDAIVTIGCLHRTHPVSTVRPKADVEKWDYDHNAAGKAAPHADSI